MKRNLRRILAVILVLVLSANGIVYAQIKGDPVFNGTVQQQSLVLKSGSRLSPDLKNLVSNPQQGAKIAESMAKPSIPAGGGSMNKFMQIKGNAVVVDITVREDINTAKSQLQKMGLRITGVFGRVISGIIPISALPQLESATSIQYARPAYKPMHQRMTQPKTVMSRMSIGASVAGGLALGVQATGVPPTTTSIPPGSKPRPVISQGDTAMLSYVARDKYHVSGKGVKVGVLSDSYNNLGTASTGVLHGELPGPTNPFNYKKPVQVLQDLDSNGTDEGRAMLEIVHSIAPGSDLAFYTADLGEASFAQGIVNLQNAGCDVIADDVFYYDEPFFQDGIVAQAVDQVKKNGTTYFSSAGNQSVRSYESLLRDSTSVEPLGPGNGTAHNFSGPGDAPRYFQPVYIPSGGSLISSFQWDESSFTASGVGCNSDLDIYLLDNHGNVVAAGNSDNLASGDPIEVFGYFNNTSNVTFYLVILKFAGPDPVHIKYILYNDALFYLTNPAIPGILTPTLVGHAKAEGAIATGAAFYDFTPPYGVDTAQIEFFSSVGGVPNYYDINGNRIAPLIRKKPEIVCPDGVNTSFFCPENPGMPSFCAITQDHDTLPNFFGTSAAAPHGAGVAALMIEAQKLRTITPDQIKGVLSAHTWEMFSVYDAGVSIGKRFNFNTGYGLIKADKAVGEVKFPNIYVKDLELKAICSANPSVTRNWEIINHNPFPVETNWQLLGSSQHGTIWVQPGDTTFSTTPLNFQHSVLPGIAIIDWQDNFEFPRFALAYSSRAVCGKDVVSESNSDQTLSGQGKTLSTSSLPGQVNIAEVSPNPSTGIFRLYLSLPGQEATTIQLFSADGRILQVRNIEQSNGVFDIDASSYRPGIYLLKITQGNYSKTVKLIRQ